MTKARITEIFSSIQGEGIYLGAKQIFVRFSGCNTDCAYCDEKRKLSRTNVSAEQLLDKIEKLDKIYGPHHSVSLTGGEPLIHSEFLRSLMPELKKKGFRIYLETNGTMPEALEGLLKYPDIIAMDIKLPSSTKNGAFWQEHKRFLKMSKAKAFVKVVVTKNTDKSDLQKAVNIVKRIDPAITFVLQPASGNGFLQDGFKGLAEFANLASRTLKDVRVIPQIHKIMGAR